MNRRALLVGLFTAAACLASAEPRFLIRTGHSGPVSALAFHEALRALVSAGEDGSVKVWDTGTFAPLYARRIADDAIALLAVHPVKARYAAAYPNEGKYHLSAWDWSEDREVFSIVLPRKPLFMDFSPRGTYLAVSVEDWNSLLLFDAEKGDRIDFPAAGSGIVSFATFSAKETTIMTYQPSGKIAYWELGTAKKIRELRTPPGLVPVTLSSDKLSLVCARRDGLVFLDAVSGRQTGTADCAGLTLTQGDRRGSDIAAMSRLAGGRESVSVFTLAGKSIRESFTTALEDGPSVTALAQAGESVYAGNRAGEVYRVLRSGAERVVRIAQLPVSDLALVGDKLVLAGANRLFVLQSGYFTQYASDVPDRLAFGVFPQTFPGSRVGLAAHDKDGLYAWQLNGSPGSLELLDPLSFRVKRQAAVFPSPLLKLTIGDSYLLSVEQSGVCRVNGLNGTGPAFEFQSAGLNAAAYIPAERIILGKSRLSSYESALAVVTGRTGETTYLAEPATMVYDFAYDDRSRHLYYLAIERIDDVPSTVVKMRGRDLEHSPSILFAKPGRYLFSSLACDRESGRLYFSLEDTFLSVWDGNGVETFEGASQPVRKIIPGANTVYALHEDSSVTAWDVASRKIRFRLHAFDNGSWLMIAGGGRYCSGGGSVDRYLELAEPGGESRDLRHRYRVDVPVTNYGKDSP